MKMHTLPRRTNRDRTSRRGSVVVLVIAFLVLVTALGATGMRRLAVARQWSNMRSDRMQQEAMFEAGMERFIVKAKRDTAFQGDDWKIQFPKRNAPPDEKLASLYTIRTTRFEVEGSSTKANELEKSPSPNHRVRFQIKVELLDEPSQVIVREKWYQGIQE